MEGIMQTLQSNKLTVPLPSMAPHLLDDWELVRYAYLKTSNNEQLPVTWQAELTKRLFANIKR